MYLIDVDELKKRANKVMFRDAPECGEFGAVAVDDIDCMPTIDPETLRLTGHWISVKDRMPKSYTALLLYGLLNPYSAIYTQYIGFWDEKKWISDGKEIEGVTHWMPLPKPPEVNTDAN